MADIRFVIDASVTLAWGFADEANAYVDAVLESLTTAEAIAPAVWPLDIGNALIVAERRGRLSKADSARFLSLLEQLPISVEQETPARMLGEIIALAREHNLSTYDASYLDLAMCQGLPLATRDEALRRAALACGVPLYLAAASGKQRTAD